MVRIRSLVIEDYDRLIALWQAAGLSYRPGGRDRRSSIESQIAASTSVFLAAAEAGELVGAVLGTHDGRKGWINRLAVLPSRRREGIGLALVKEVEKRLEALGIHIVTCLIEDWNAESMEFFERIGYVEHGECVYYSKRMNPDV